MGVPHNYTLVTLSLVVAVLSSYTALDLTARIRTMRVGESRRIAWLLSAATVLGTGIWSMHFIGMLAFKMPMPVGYDLRLTFVSFLIAVCFCFFAMSVFSRKQVGSVAMTFSALTLGLAIAAMHYVGMAAMRMNPAVTYKPVLFTASILIAITAAGLALWVTARLWNEDQTHLLPKRCGAAVILGLAIAGMHYTGMSAAVFSPNAVCHSANLVHTTWLAVTVAASTLVLLLAALLLSRLQKVHDSRSTQMHASLEEANQRLLVMATQDPLTKLANRAYLLECTREMITRSDKNHIPFTVMFTDLDGFKTINDSLGHDTGDKLLIQFANHLRRVVRRGDVVARIGGDEFVLLLQGLGLQRHTSPIARDILHRMQHDFVVSGMPLRLTTSIGISSYPEDGNTAEELLKNADMAMYDAKGKGKNDYSYYDHGMSRVASRTHFIYRALTEAFEKKQMSLHFQPKFRGVKEELAGAEALIRWHHPEYGEISPLQFIPIAERTGQIVKVGNWVIQEVCRQMNEWDREGLPPLKIAINLSPEQLCFPRYIEIVVAILRSAKITSDRILFEITETAAMRNAELSAQVLRQFKLAGFDIAIDDFGMGYTSLAYLQQFRVTQLKIDRFFIRGLDSSVTGGVAIVAAIIGMAHALDMVVVAEGVETLTQLARLQSLSCDEFQGFLLGRPQAALAFTHFLRSRIPAAPKQALPSLPAILPTPSPGSMGLIPPHHERPQGSALTMK